MALVRVFMKQGCPYSAGAKRLLDEKGIAYEELDVEAEPARRSEMERLSGGKKTVPQIFFGDRHVGGYTELQELDRTEGIRHLASIGEDASAG